MRLFRLNLSFFTRKSQLGDPIMTFLISKAKFLSQLYILYLLLSCTTAFYRIWLAKVTQLLVATNQLRSALDIMALMSPCCLSLYLSWEQQDILERIQSCNFDSVFQKFISCLMQLSTRLNTYPSVLEQQFLKKVRRDPQKTFKTKNMMSRARRPRQGQTQTVVIRALILALLEMVFDVTLLSLAIRVGSVRKYAVSAKCETKEKMSTLMKKLCRLVVQFLGVWQNLKRSSLSQKQSRNKEMAAIGIRIGSTPENEKVTKKMAIRQAYLYPIGKISSMQRSKYSLLVLLDVGTLQHRVSQHFLKHFRIKERKNSAMGVAMLKTRVRTIMDPMPWYQSDVKSSNLPRKMKLTSVRLICPLQLQLSKIIISPIFITNKKARLRVQLNSSSITNLCFSKQPIHLKMQETITLQITIPSEISKGTTRQSLYWVDQVEQQLLFWDEKLSRLSFLQMQVTQLGWESKLESTTCNCVDAKRTLQSMPQLQSVKSCRCLNWIKPNSRQLPTQMMMVKIQLMNTLSLVQLYLFSHKIISGIGAAWMLQTLLPTLSSLFEQQLSWIRLLTIRFLLTVSKTSIRGTLSLEACSIWNLRLQNQITFLMSIWRSQAYYLNFYWPPYFSKTLWWHKWKLSFYSLPSGKQYFLISYVISLKIQNFSLQYYSISQFSGNVYDTIEVTKFCLGQIC